MTMVSLSLFAIWSAAAMLTAGCAATQADADDVRSSPMLVEFTIALTRTNLVAGESAPLAMTFVNKANKPVAIPHPDQSQRWPSIRVLNVASKKEKSYSTKDVAAATQDDFAVPLPERTITLAPNQKLTIVSDLSSRIILPVPGEYEISGTIEYAGGASTSNALRVSVEPLRFHGGFLAGAHAGNATPQYLVYSHGESQKSAILLSSLSLDPHGHAVFSPGMRVAELKNPVRPVLSVPQFGAGWPAQWIVWTDLGTLCGTYLMQAEVQVPVKSHALRHEDARIIGPAFLDLAKAKDLNPAPCHVPLWLPNPAGAQLAVKTFQPDGSLADGPVFNMGRAEFAWGYCAFRKSGDRSVIVATQRGNNAELDLVRLSVGGAAPKNLAKWPGTPIGGGAILNDDDVVMGTTVIRTQVMPHKFEYQVEKWSIDSSGAYKAGSPTAIHVDSALMFERAIVGLSPTGKIFVLMQMKSKAWFCANWSGVCVPLPDKLARAGEPATVYWPDDAEPVIVIVGPEIGCAAKHIPKKEVPMPQPAAQ